MTKERVHTTVVYIVVLLLVLTYSITSSLISVGGNLNDVGHSVTVDTTGNYYVTGYVQGLSSFDGLPFTSFGNKDIFIAKYDQSGVIQWVTSAGSTGDDEGRGITYDQTRMSVIVTGSFTGVANFSGTFVTSNGMSDIFIARYRSIDGELEQVSMIGGSQSDVGSSVTFDTTNSVPVVVGSISDSTYLTSFGGSDVFVSGGDTFPSEGGGNGGEDNVNVSNGDVSVVLPPGDNSPVESSMQDELEPRLSDGPQVQESVPQQQEESQDNNNQQTTVDQQQPGQSQEDAQSNPVAVSPSIFEPMETSFAGLNSKVELSENVQNSQIQGGSVEQTMQNEESIAAPLPSTEESSPIVVQPSPSVISSPTVENSPVTPVSSPEYSTVELSAETASSSHISPAVSSVETSPQGQASSNGQPEDSALPVESSSVFPTQSAGVSVDASAGGVSASSQVDQSSTEAGESSKLYSSQQPVASPTESISQEESIYKSSSEMPLPSPTVSQIGIASPQESVAFSSSQKEFSSSEEVSFDSSAEETIVQSVESELSSGSEQSASYRSSPPVYPSPSQLNSPQVSLSEEESIFQSPELSYNSDTTGVQQPSNSGAAELTAQGSSVVRPSHEATQSSQGIQDSNSFDYSSTPANEGSLSPEWTFSRSSESEQSTGTSQIYPSPSASLSSGLESSPAMSLETEESRSSEQTQQLSTSDRFAESISESTEASISSLSESSTKSSPAYSSNMMSEQTEETIDVSSSGEFLSPSVEIQTSSTTEISEESMQYPSHSESNFVTTSDIAGISSTPSVDTQQSSNVEYNSASVGEENSLSPPEWTINRSSEEQVSSTTHDSQLSSTNEESHYISSQSASTTESQPAQSFEIDNSAQNSIQYPSPAYSELDNSASDVNEQYSSPQSSTEQQESSHTIEEANSSSDYARSAPIFESPQDSEYSSSRDNSESVDSASRMPSPSDAEHSNNMQSSSEEYEYNSFSEEDSLSPPEWTINRSDEREQSTGNEEESQIYPSPSASLSSDLESPAISLEIERSASSEHDSASPTFAESSRTYASQSEQYTSREQTDSNLVSAEDVHSSSQSSSAMESQSYEYTSVPTAEVSSVYKSSPMPSNTVSEQPDQSSDRFQSVEFSEGAHSSNAQYASPEESIHQSSASVSTSSDFGSSPASEGSSSEGIYSSRMPSPSDAEHSSNMQSSSEEYEYNSFSEEDSLSPPEWTINRSDEREQASSSYLEESNSASISSAGSDVSSTGYPQEFSAVETTSISPQESVAQSVEQTQQQSSESDQVSSSTAPLATESLDSSNNEMSPDVSSSFIQATNSAERSVYTGLSSEVNTESSKFVESSLTDESSTYASVQSSDTESSPAVHSTADRSDFFSSSSELDPSTQNSFSTDSSVTYSPQQSVENTFAESPDISSEESLAYSSIDISNTRSSPASPSPAETTYPSVAQSSQQESNMGSSITEDSTGVFASSQQDGSLPQLQSESQPNSASTAEISNSADLASSPSASEQLGSSNGFGVSPEITPGSSVPFTQSSTVPAESPELSTEQSSANQIPSELNSESRSVEESSILEEPTILRSSENVQSPFSSPSENIASPSTGADTSSQPAIPSSSPIGQPSIEESPLPSVEQSVTSPEFFISMSYQTNYAACDEPTISAHAFKVQGNEEITSSVDFNWRVIGLENENYITSETVKDSTGSSVTLDFATAGRGRQYNVTITASYAGLFTVKTFALVSIEDFSYQATVAQPSISTYSRLDTLQLTAQVSSSSCAPGSSGQWSISPNVSSVPSSLLQGSVLALPLSNLPAIERSYSFHYTATPLYSGIAYANRIAKSVQSETATISIQLRALTAVISSPKGLVATVGDSLQFNALKSTDPENSGISPTYAWSCTSGCSISSSTSNSVTISFSSAGTHTITLAYSVGSRTSTASVKASIYSGDTPLPRVSLSTIAPVVSRRTKFSVSAVAIGTTFSELDLKWTLAKQPSTTVTLNSTVLSVASDSERTLVLKSNVLDAGSSYTVTLFAKYKNQTEFLVSVSQDFSTSSPPITGTFTVSPMVGTALTTAFTMSVAGWSSTDSATLTYRFQYYNPIQRKYIPISSTTGSSVTVKLPQGFENSNNQTVMDVYVFAENSFGDNSSKVVTIEVNALPTDQLASALEDATASLENEQDPGVLLNSLSSLVASLSNLGSTNSTAGLRRNMLSLLTRTRNAPLSPAVASAQVSMLNTITEGDEEMSQESQEAVFSVLGNILDSPTASSIIEPEVLNDIAGVVSTVADSAFSETLGSEESANKTLNLVTSISNVVISNIQAGEEPQTIITKNIEMLFQSEYGQNLLDSVVYEPSSGSSGRRSLLNTQNVSVKLPVLEILSTTDAPLFIQYVKYNNGKNPYFWSNSSKPITTGVVTFKLNQLDEEGTPTEFQLQDLENPLEVHVTKDVPGFHPNVTYSCQSWDESDPTVTEWSDYGCYYHNETYTHVICRCTHATSFAAFIQYDQNSKVNDALNKGIFIYSIIYYTIVGIFAIALLIFVFLNRQHQPIASRHIVPYVGLVAIIAEALIQGIIRNSMLLALDVTKHFRALNAISYIVVCIVSPLGLMALCVFLWQMFRYLFLRKLTDEIVNGGERSTIRVFRIVTNKILFTLVVLAVGLASAAYFIFWSILGGASVMTPTANSIVQAVSYWMMEIVVAITIVAVFIWDLIVRQKQEITDAKSVYENHNTISLETTTVARKEKTPFVTSVKTMIYNHFVKNDPLMFRLEACFMLLSIGVLAIAFILGLSENFSFISKSAKYDAPITVGRVVFDTFYITLRLLVFGGFISIVRVKDMIKNRGETQPNKIKAIVKEASTIEADETFSTINNLLKNDKGFAVMQEYCAKEMSVENILLWREVTAAKENFVIMTEKERRALLDKINSEHIKSNSPYEVNINAETRRMWNNYLKKDDVSQIEDALKVIKKLDSAVMTNISDTFSRFSTTPEYIAYTKASSMTAELEKYGFAMIDI